MSSFICGILKILIEKERSDSWLPGTEDKGEGQLEEGGQNYKLPVII